MFETFAERRIDVSEAEIYLRTGGAGPPLLLLHGYPQTHLAWHRLAPMLAQTYTVVAPDLRGYGDSILTGGDVGPPAFAKRAMALDQIAVMQALGFERFALVGHD